jgi:glycine betaine/proline transport system substrate-binding protein
MRGIAMTFAGVAALLSLAGAVPTAAAAEGESCRKVRMADGGWTDNTAQNGLVAAVLRGLGYEVDAKVLAMPVILKGLEGKDLDVWLDNWLPSQNAETKPYFDAGTVINLAVNLEGAGYGPVVPAYVAEQGVKGLTDLPQFADKFDRKMYGIEAGNDGNRILQAKIDDKANDLAGWSLVESSEQAMLAQVDKLTKKQEWVVFLAWAPHPVMGKMDIRYLTGFEADGFGAATIHTLTRAGFAEDCPNLGQFFRNLRFTLDMESAVMQAILDGKDAEASGAEWLRANPAVLETWLAGVTTTDGAEALPAARAKLGL